MAEDKTLGDIMINCRFCGAFISHDWSNLSYICASCKHKSDWIECAEYEVMGHWDTPVWDELVEVPWPSP